MTQAERQQKLDALAQEVKKYAKRERERLVAERNFLKAVLDSSLGGPVQRANEISQLTALNEVRKYVQVTA